MAAEDPTHVENVVGNEEDSKMWREPEVFEGQWTSEVRAYDPDSDTPPTAEEWKSMKGYGSFITHDEDDGEHIFHVNDIITVLPTGHDPEDEVDPIDLWIAQIRSIRAHDSDSVWIKAKWFYHPTELPKKVKGATPLVLAVLSKSIMSQFANRKTRRFGKYERLSSNQADFIPTSTCCGTAKIIPFNEQDLEQEEIDPGVFYYRYDFDWQAGTLKRTAPPCSICKKTYNPDTDTMHFCPRQRCCRSWHTTCLAAANWFIKSPAIDLPQRLESLDDGWTPSTEAMDCGPKKKVRIEASLSLKPLPQDDPYARVPPALLAVARQPIARGGALGVVGNVRSVVRARKMLQNALKGVEGVPEDWEGRLGKVHDASVIGPYTEETGKGKGKGKGKVLAYQCPQCGEPI